MMKTLATISLLATSLVLFSFSTTNNYTGIAGTWKCPEMDNSVIYIWKSAKTGDYFGKITESDNSKYKDQTILRNVAFSDNKKTGSGTLKHPERGELNINLSATSDFKKLTVVGTKLFITKTFIWHRVK